MLLTLGYSPKPLAKRCWTPELGRGQLRQLRNGAPRGARGLGKRATPQNSCRRDRQASELQVGLVKPAHSPALPRMTLDLDGIESPVISGVESQDA